VVSKGKKQISPHLGTPRKILEHPLVVPPVKNPSDAHGREMFKHNCTCDYKSYYHL